MDCSLVTYVSSIGTFTCFISSSLFYRLKTLTESSQVLFLKRKYNFFSEYANMMTAAESTDLFKAKPIVKTDPIPDSLIVLELVRKHDTPDLIESANFFISTISVGYRSLFYIPLKVHVPVLSRLINIGNVEIFDENAIPTP